MVRRVFTVASDVSFLGFVLGSLFTIGLAEAWDTPYGYYWFGVGIPWNKLVATWASYNWVLLIVLAIPPAIRLFDAVVRPRTTTPTGYCTSCGYDLRASKGRCPECGTPIASDVGEAG